MPPIIVINLTLEGSRILDRGFAIPNPGRSIKRIRETVQFRGGVGPMVAPDQWRLLDLSHKTSRLLTIELLDHISPKSKVVLVNQDNYRRYGGTTEEFKKLIASDWKTPTLNYPIQIVHVHDRGLHLYYDTLNTKPLKKRKDQCQLSS